MIANYRFIILFLIPKITMLLILSQIGLMSDIINILIILHFLLLILCEVHLIKVIPDDWLIIQLFDTD